MRRHEGTILIGVLLSIITAGIVALMMLAGPHSMEAAPNTNTIITQPPTWCQEGNWTIDDWTYLGKRCINVPTPSPAPTSTPTPTCWTVRYYPQYSPNSLNTEPPWSSNFNPMSLEMIPQSYNGCDGVAINKVQYWDPYDRNWVEGAWGLTDYNYWKEVYTGLLTVEYKEGRMCGCK